MDSSSTYCNDSEHIDNQLSKSPGLELAYQEALCSTNLTVKDEAARRLRLRILMLENENDDLHEHIAVADDRIDLLDQNSDDLRIQLEHTQEEARQREAELKSQTREVNNLRTEVASMNGVTVDSTKLLTEKLSLARELATLKTELDHLRSQTTYQQTILSEKLALQRQVSSLEVELETERRATKRAAQKNDSNEKDMALQKQVDALQKDLSREKKEGARALKEHEKELQAYEARQAVLDNKLEEAKAKLRSSKEQIKEYQSELTHARAATVKTTKVLLKGDASTRKPKKKGALEVSTDITGTPGEPVTGRRTGGKRGRLDQTTIGEKSTFSITPFLNRTLNLAPESSSQSLDPNIMEEEDDEDEGVTDQTPSRTQSLRLDPSSPTPLPRTKGRKLASKTPRRDKNVLLEADHNVQTNKSESKKLHALGKLDGIAEEDADENEQPISSAVVSQKSITKLLATAKKANPKQSKVQLKNPDLEEDGPKKKKKKLLGATIFDEEDIETMKRPAKSSLARQRVLGKGPQADGRGAPKGVLAGGSGFGLFSPLKKERKAVGGSFMA